MSDRAATPARAPSHQTVRLARGRHRHAGEGACAMELASMLAGEHFTDHPRSVCPLIAALARVYNDRSDDERRQDLVAIASLSVDTAEEDPIQLRRLAVVERWTRERFPRRRVLRRAAVSICARAGDYDGLAVLTVRAAGRSADGHRALLELFEELAALRSSRGAAAEEPVAAPVTA